MAGSIDRPPRFAINKFPLVAIFTNNLYLFVGQYIAVHLVILSGLLQAIRDSGVSIQQSLHHP